MLASARVVCCDMFLVTYHLGLLSPFLSFPVDSVALLDRSYHHMYVGCGTQIQPPTTESSYILIIWLFLVCTSFTMLIDSACIKVHATLEQCLASAAELVVQARAAVAGPAAIKAEAVAAAVALGILDVHPFTDGNGRLSRLVLSRILTELGLPFPIVLCASSAQRNSFCCRSTRRCLQSARPGWGLRAGNVQAAPGTHGAGMARVGTVVGGVRLCST